MSTVEDVEKLIWEVERRPSLYLKNWKNIVIESKGDIVVRNLQVSRHELKWASSWTEIRKSYLNLLVHIIGDHVN